MAPLLRLAMLDVMILTVGLLALTILMVAIDSWRAEPGYYPSSPWEVSRHIIRKLSKCINLSPPPPPPWTGLPVDPELEAFIESERQRGLAGPEFEAMVEEARMLRGLELDRVARDMAVKAQRAPPEAAHPDP